MRNDAMGIQRVRHLPAELEVDAGRLAVRAHQLHVHLHLLVRVAVFGLLVPGVFVLAFFRRGRVELVGEVFDVEGYWWWGGGGGADEAEGCGGWKGWRKLVMKARLRGMSGERVEVDGLPTFIQSDSGISAVR